MKTIAIVLARTAVLSWAGMRPVAVAPASPFPVPMTLPVPWTLGAYPTLPSLGGPGFFEASILFREVDRQIKTMMASQRAAFAFRARAERPAILNASAPAPGSGVPAPGSGAPGFDAWGPEWRRGYFMGEDGAKLSYLYREGRGPAVLLIHGRGIGTEGFAGWAGRIFPGRAVVLLERRGYGLSGIGAVDERNLGELGSADIGQAIGLAQRLGGGGRVALLTYSLGAMLLPRLPSERVLWVAYLNPGVFGMLRHMEPSRAATSLALAEAYAWSRLWHPSLRAAWTQATANSLLQDLIERLRTQGTSRELAESIIAEIRGRLRDPAYQELVIQETVWALFGRAPSPLPWDVPVFVGISGSDEIVPHAAFAELLEGLRAGGAHPTVVRWSGGHLAPIFNSDAVIERLEEFDRSVLGGAE